MQPYHQLKRQLERMNLKKAAGPDGARPGGLRGQVTWESSSSTWARKRFQCCGIFSHQPWVTINQWPQHHTWRKSWRDGNAGIFQDPLQFGVGVENSNIHMHQGGNCGPSIWKIILTNTAKIVFFYVSSVFNTVTSAVLWIPSQLPRLLTTWHTEQFVKPKGCVSSAHVPLKAPLTSLRYTEALLQLLWTVWFSNRDGFYRCHPVTTADAWHVWHWLI